VPTDDVLSVSPRLALAVHDIFRELAIVGYEVWIVQEEIKCSVLVSCFWMQCLKDIHLF